jgi:hypothetical protein
MHVQLNPHAATITGGFSYPAVVRICAWPVVVNLKVKTLSERFSTGQG